MGLYARRVFPRLMNLAMDSRVVARERAGLVPAATGRVLEIGIGSGLNIPYYTGAVECLCGIDPSIELWRLGRRRAARAPFPVRFIRASAEVLPVATGTFDTVVTTWTLCSIADPGAALAEMRRVLAPGGRVLFIEHGGSPEPRVLAWQNRITPVWRRLAGGCHLNRPIADMVRAAGLRLELMDVGYGEGPKIFTYRWKGVATAES